MATAKKTVTKKVNVTAAVIHNAAETVAEKTVTIESVMEEVMYLRAELAALKARLFHPSEN